MRWLVALGAKIGHRRHESLSEQVPPNTVDRNPRRKRVGGIDEPASEIEASLSGILLPSPPEAGKMTAIRPTFPGDFLAQAQKIAADVDVRGRGSLRG